MQLSKIVRGLVSCGRGGQDYKNACLLELLIERRSDSRLLCSGLRPG